jgi:hypothetical protein
MSYTARPALTPAFALLFAGYTADEIATAAAERLAFFCDLAADAASDLGARLSLPVAAAAAAVRDGAQAAPVTVQDAIEHAAASAEPLRGDAAGRDASGGDHLTPAERAAWRLSCALRAPRCLLARLLAPLGLSLAALVRSRRVADVDAAGLGTTEIRAKGGQSGAFHEAQGSRWTTGEGSRKPRADSPAAVLPWATRAQIERAVLALPEDASPALISRSVLAYC